MEQVDFFISYNQADRHWASGLANWLDQALFTTVMQFQDFVAGSNFVSEMNAALEQARRVIAVASPNYFAAHFPEAEWTAAFVRDPIGAKRTLILVRVCDCDIPALLKPLVYIDLVGLNQIPAQEKFIAEIKAAITSKRTPRKQQAPATDDPTGSGPISGSAVLQSAHGNGNVQVGRDYIRTEKHTTRNVIEPGPEHISEQQAFQIKEMIDKLAEIDVLAGRPDSHGAWYKRLYKRYRITSYKLLQTADYQNAASYLRQQIAIAQPKLRRRDNVAWRDHKYRAIWAKARKLGLTTEQIHQLAIDRLELKTPISSLKELGEQNLMRFYRIMLNRQ